MRRLLCLLVLGMMPLLAACSARLHPAGPPVREARLEAAAWIAADGAVLPVRTWGPQDNPKAVIVALHGMNDYSNFFDGPGNFLATRDILSYAYDQRGFGAGPHPGFWSDGADMAADLKQFIRLLARRHPDLPLFVLGESMGGAVAMLAFSDIPPTEVRGLILSAPAVWGRSGMGWAQRGLLWISATLLPGMELTGEGLKITPSDNIEMLRRLSRDPLVIKKTRTDTIRGLVDLMDAAQAKASHLGLPLLVLYGKKDEIIPAGPTWRAIRAMKGPRVALYQNGYHMLLRDLQAETVLADIAAWIFDRAALLPSNAETAVPAQ